MDACASVVELTISCRNLPNMDVLSKSDPMCVVLKFEPGRNVWQEVGRTEIIWDNLNPEFSKKITMPYFFEERQQLRFEVYDIDSASSDLSEHDFCGRADAALGEIVATSGLKAFERDLIGNRNNKCGTIRVLAEEVSSCKEEYSIKLEAEHLPTRFFGKNSFFFEIHKSTETAGYSLVYRSSTLVAGRNVHWPQFVINLYSLCNGDLDRNIKITLMQHKSNGSHKSLGAWNTTVRTLSENSRNLPFILKLESGSTFRLLNLSKGSHSSFLDFIKIGGVQMHCFLAVDFTASNGNPMQPSSLHYIHPTIPNQYQMALRSVLEIVQDYDSDKLFPALGFGAQLPPSWAVSHEFFLNMHPTNPYCEGIEGVMSAYTRSLQTVKFHGPTNFAPIINHVSRFAFSNSGGNNYFILLIITDGVISDMPQTVNAIVAASSLPMSIIIVGVGSADFSAMHILDADDKPLVDTNGRQMERDIVQFVPFTEILQKAGNNVVMAKVELAREVLAEVPGQFLSYMKKVGVTAEKLAASRNGVSSNGVNGVNGANH